MKKLLFFILSAILLFTLMSCAKDDNGEGDSEFGFPTIPQDGDFEWSDFGFKQGIFFYTSFFVGIDLLSYEEPETWGFRLNGEQIEIEWDEYKERREDDEWWAIVDGEDLPEEVDLTSGSTISYYLQVNNTISSGELTIPYQVYVDWDDFDFDEDFEFDWEIQQNPDLHLVFMDFECEIDDEEYNVYRIWQLPGSQREYVIPKSYYQEYENCDYYWFCVALYAINFMNTGDCIAISETFDWYDSGYWRSERKPNKKEHIKRIIEAFKNNSH